MGLFGVRELTGSLMELEVSMVGVSQGQGYGRVMVRDTWEEAYLD